MINLNWLMETVLHRTQNMCHIIKEAHCLKKSADYMMRNARYLMIYALNVLEMCAA